MKSLNIKISMIAALLAFYSTTTVAQEVAGTQAAPQAVVASTDAPAEAPVQFDAQYEDSGVKVYITKVFPQYQMKEGQMSTVGAAQHGIIADALANHGVPIDIRRIFHSVPSDALHVGFSPIFAGTRTSILSAIEHQNVNRVVGAAGAVLMFAVSRGTSGAGTSALSNLTGLRDVVGTGMLRSGEFQRLEISKNQGITTEPNEIIYISTVLVKHSQNDSSLGDSKIYLVVPNEMKGEVFTGRNIGELSYGSNFSAVLTRAVLKSVNIVPAAKSVAIENVQ